MWNLAAVLPKNLQNSSIYAPFSQFCTSQPTLCKILVQNYRILASLVVVVREGGEERDTWGTYRLSLSLFQACRQSVCSTYLTFFTWAVVMWPLATNSSATCYRWLCCQGVCDDEMSLKNLGSSATAVTKALDDLMLHIKRGANRGRQVAEAC